MNVRHPKGVKILLNFSKIEWNKLDQALYQSLYTVFCLVSGKFLLANFSSECFPENCPLLPEATSERCSLK